MLKTLAAAVVAVSLIGGPALAQGNAPASNTNQPAAMKTDAAPSKVKTVKNTRHHRAHISKRHYRKHVRHASHHISHLKHVRQPAKIKPAG